MTSEQHPARRWWPRFALAGILLLALALAIWQPIGADRLLQRGAQVASLPGAVVGIILLQIGLLALALPGSAVVWLVAPFHSPPVAVAILLAGSIPGSLAAYAIARRLAVDGPFVNSARLPGLLRDRKDFLTQCALRILPGVPHWGINYSAGTLGLPRLPFTLAAAIGLSIKWSAYAWAIHEVTAVAEAERAIGPGTLLALIGLALIFLIASLVRRRLLRPGRPA